MNQTIDNILSRRSCRAFKPEQVEKSRLQAVLDCALSAPSACNAQNVHFTVVQNPDLLDWMNDKIKEKLPEDARRRNLDRAGGDENFSVFYHAPTVVLVFSQKGDHYSPINASLAVQNICVAAESLDIATCVIGLAQFLFSDDNADDYMAELGVPEGYEFVLSAALGSGDMEPPRPGMVEGRVNYIE